jgi:hypothetical protein
VRTEGEVVQSDGSHARMLAHELSVFQRHP